MPILARAGIVSTCNPPAPLTEAEIIKEIAVAMAKGDGCVDIEDAEARKLGWTCTNPEPHQLASSREYDDFARRLVHGFRALRRLGVFAA